MQYLLDSQICMNVLHFWHGTENWTIAELTSLLSELEPWVGDSVLPQMASAVTHRQMVARGLNSEDDPVVVNSALAGDPGGIVSEPMPNQCALVVSLLTNVGGRTGRGRAYHLGLTESVCSGNLVSTTYRDDVKNAYETLLTIAAGAPWSWGVLSRRSGGVPRPEGIIRTIVALSVDRQIDSQDRRTPGHGT